jgi:O-antigen/teichoic acid export membrane protein
MIKLGFVLASSVFLASGVKFAISAFITRTGSLSDLGLYNAGIAITMGYTGLIFTAMTQDYFPRLTEAVHKKGEYWRKIINEQTHLIAIILTPILLFILTVLPWMIKLLLSDEFMEITNFVSLFILGIFLEGPNWTMGVMIEAKSDLKVKMYSELLANIVFLILNIAFYYYYGLMGIGFGFLLSKFFSLLITWSIVRFRYSFRFDLRQSVILVISFLTCSFLSAVQILKGYPLTHYIGIMLFIISVAFSIKELNKKIDLQAMVKEVISKFKNR